MASLIVGGRARLLGRCPTTRSGNPGQRKKNRSSFHTACNLPACRRSRMTATAWCTMMILTSGRGSGGPTHVRMYEGAGWPRRKVGAELVAQSSLIHAWSDTCSFVLSGGLLSGAVGSPAPSSGAVAPPSGLRPRSGPP